LTLRYSLLLSVWVDPSAEHIYLDLDRYRFTGVQDYQGARAVLLPCAQLLWCELYVMKDLPQKIKNLLIPAAAGFFSLDATSGLLATASASAPAMFLALRSALLCACV